MATDEELWRIGSACNPYHAGVSSDTRTATGDAVMARIKFRSVDDVRKYLGVEPSTMANNEPICVNWGPIIEPKPLMSFAEWCEKRVMTRPEYEKLKEAGELDPMGVYVVVD